MKNKIGFCAQFSEEKTEQFVNERHKDHTLLSANYQKK